MPQRRNRRGPIFFERGDEAVYRDLMGREARRRGVEVWAYCLMPNRVHLIMTPRSEKAELTGRSIGAAEFIAGVEQRLGRRIGPFKRRRKPRPSDKEGQGELL